MPKFSNPFLEIFNIIRQVQIMEQVGNEEFKEALEQYRNRMEEIAENQNFLPVRYFQEAEHLIRSEVLQSVKQTDLSTLQRTLLEWRSELYSRNQTAIARWCNDLLVECTNNVDKKIGREIKSFNTYRQEILMTFDLLRKKTEPYLTCDLANTIADYIIQKILENSIQLNTLALTQIQDQLKVLEIENKALTVQCKQAKRRTNKEDNETQRTIAQLRESINILQTKISLLEQDNEQLRRDLQTSEETKEESLIKVKEESNMQLSQLRERLESHEEEAREAIKRSTFLEMELEKEQLLHKQTMLHYEELVSSYHCKQEYLKEEILEASRVSEKEIDQFRLLSTRRIEDCQQSSSQLEQQLESTEQALKSKEAEVLALRDELIAEKGRSRTQTTTLTNQIMQLQLRNKVLEQKQAECDNLKYRLQRSDAELKKIQKDREHLQQLCKQNEKEKLIAQQKYQYLKQQYEEEHIKSSLLADEIFRKEKEMIEIKNFKSIAEKSDSCIQTDETEHRQKLKEALEMIKDIEAEYLKLRGDYDKKRKRHI